MFGQKQLENSYNEIGKAGAEMPSLSLCDKELIYVKLMLLKSKRITSCVLTDFRHGFYYKKGIPFL